MMLEQASVLHYHNGIARIQCFAKSGCGSCAAQGCGTKSLSALAGEKSAPQFELKVDKPLQMGDIIEIGILENSLLQSVFWLYAVPLAVLIATTLFFSMLFENELLIATAIVVNLLGTFFGINTIIKRRKLAELKPVFVRKL